ncbi:hypothetical protein ACW0TQ_08235 [Oceanobacillus sp. M60]
MEYVTKYDKLPELKLEIENYVQLLFSQRNLIYSNEVRSITKCVIFTKKIITYTGESHYKNSLIFDVLSTMHSLTGNSIRQFHYIFRSFLENFVRVFLKLKDNDETGINELFRNITEIYGVCNKTTELIDFIYSEYSNSCMVVHSNQKSNTKIQTYYKEIIQNDDFDKHTLNRLINKVLLTLKKMIELLVYSYPQVIENAFYRNKQELKYLIKDELYSIFLSKVK